jgi:ATP-dependent Clp protease adaptor protein ClpS
MLRLMENTVPVMSLNLQNQTALPRLNDRREKGAVRPSVAPIAIVDARPKAQKPSLYKVLILNDDYTPMEFVVYVLERFFHKSADEATKIMLHVHQYGVGVCGVYTYEIAETKVAQVVDMARRHQHPLQCTMEKDS